MASNDNKINIFVFLFVNVRYVIMLIHRLMNVEWGNDWVNTC